VHGFPQSRQATEERSRLRKAYHKGKPRSHRGTETGSKEARREKRQEAKETEEAEEAEEAEDAVFERSEQRNELSVCAAPRISLSSVALQVYLLVINLAIY
jgi:hypothetical protein